MKTKTCYSCSGEFDVMYRVQLQKNGPWVFVCRACCEKHRKQAGYRYGGAWKGYRH